MTTSGSRSDLELSSDDDADYGVVQNEVGAYQGEPLANYEDEEYTGLLTMLLMIQTGHL